MDNHIKTAEKLDSSELIKGNKKDMPIRTQIPLAITYHGILSSSQIIWKTGTYYQLTNLWKKNSKRTSCSFQTQQKSQGTHWQQQNWKQNCKENKKSTLKPWKCSPYLEITEFCAATKSQQHQLSKVNKVKKQANFGKLIAPAGIYF